YTAGADAKSHAAGAPWAMSHVRFSISAAIDAPINTAAAEMNADEQAIVALRAARKSAAVATGEIELVIARIAHAFSSILLQISGIICRTSAPPWARSDSANAPNRARSAASLTSARLMRTLCAAHRRVAIASSVQTARSESRNLFAIG